MMARTAPPGTFCGGIPPKGLANYAGSDGQTGLLLPQFRVIRKQVAQYVNQAGPGTVVTVLFYARNPSPRLRWSISLGWELDPAKNFVPFVVGTGPTWQMRAVRMPYSGGSPADLDDIFVDSSGVATPRQLPDGYEIDSAVKDVRGTVTLHDGSGRDLDSGQFGNLVAEARWEPHDGFVDRGEIAQLLQQADLYIIGNAPVLANGT